STPISPEAEITAFASARLAFSASRMCAKSSDYCSRPSSKKNPSPMNTDPKLRPQLNPQLEAGEWVYWAGKPLPLRMALEEREGLILGVLALIVLVILQIIYSRTYIFSVPLL